MNEQVEKLCKLLHFDTKLKYEHDFDGQLLPFFTREPERMKFTNGFSPVIGVIARIINDKNVEFQQTEFDVSNTSLDSDVDDRIINQLFSPTLYRSMRSSKLLQYIPLSAGKDKKGEIRIGEFLIDLLKLRSNDSFVNMFKENQPNNLYENIIFESLDNEEENQKQSHHNFKYYDDSNYFSRFFDNDMRNFKKDNEYFYAHIGELLEFYYLTYVIQATMRISNATVKNNEKIIPIYFNFGNESVSKTRQSIQSGYPTAYQHGQGLLMDIDILNYANILIPDEHFYWKNEILDSEFLYKNELFNNLNEFIKEFCKQLNQEVIEKINFEYQNLNDEINCLRSLLETRKDKSPDSRYAKSFMAIAQQNYSRRHGGLGKSFSLSSQTVLMLTAGIVGNGKMLLNQVFKEFENRGVFFDRITKDQIINLFEQANILEKLSDSGDAQYVRGIL